MTAKIHLLLIDPQNDFVKTPAREGSLAVPGGHEDCVRMAQFVAKHGKVLDDIHVTLDSHRTIDVAHPYWWVNEAGQHPDPYTVITPSSLAKKEWMTRIPYPSKLGLTPESYVQRLEDTGRYPLCIWPEHCRIGGDGNNVHPDLFEALTDWEHRRYRFVDYVTKGSNPYTEHYSAVRAEVPIPTDPSTMMNTPLIDMLKSCDKIIVAGEALSHCLANTLRDIGSEFGEENIRKFILLRDCTSNVPGFEKRGDDFLQEFIAKGMEVTTSVDFQL